MVTTNGFQMSSLDGPARDCGQAPARRPDLHRIRSWLAHVPDPEMPMLSICDLGMVRAIAWIEGENEAELVVTLTPTYTGCPATSMIAADVIEMLKARGISQARVDISWSPPWTTDWLSAEGRRKLAAAGIAPPQRQAMPEASGSACILRRALAVPVPVAPCPLCGSPDTKQTSDVGAAPCRALFWCDGCSNPFEYFKRH